MDHGLLGDRLRHVDGRSLLELLLGQVLNLCMMRSLQSQAFTFLTPAGVQVLTFLSTCTRVLAQTTAVQLDDGVAAWRLFLMLVFNVLSLKEFKNSLCVFISCI
ncbi:hypothetical protein AMECASPLE_015710 [Ameca splendens]|uniref:Secreted protein n=1 Tax=Ameca splendens TaxID=208324 RepID=A0ABV1A9P1_9TELE